MELTKEQLNEYDTIIIAFSGGKDSTASFLNILDSGIDKNKIASLYYNIFITILPFSIRKKQ
jgi:predicted phosphoadenosine phosphosulfate sulfurtransferase